MDDFIPELLPLDPAQTVRLSAPQVRATPAVQMEVGRTPAGKSDGFVPYDFPPDSPCLRPARRWVPSPAKARKMFFNPHFDELPDEIQDYYLNPDPTFREEMIIAPIISIERLEYSALPRAFQNSENSRTQEVIVVRRKGCRGADYWSYRSGRPDPIIEGAWEGAGYRKIGNISTRP